MLDELTAVEVVVRIFEAQNLSGKSVGKGGIVLEQKLGRLVVPSPCQRITFSSDTRSFLSKLK